MTSTAIFYNGKQAYLKVDQSRRPLTWMIFIDGQYRGDICNIERVQAIDFAKQILTKEI